MGDRETPRDSLDPTVFIKSSAGSSVGFELAAAPMPLEGTRLRHFEVVRLLGRGGMGAVFYGTDTALDRPVAIKVLAPELAHEPDVVARFEREARAQARLRHPNVSQIYFIGEDRGYHFFVMEYLEGPGLEALLDQSQRLPWSQALDFAIAAARGLRAALAHGFIHRDVKPSNLMLDREAGLKILDFGLVKSMHGDAQLTRDGAIIGSPLYMSPEQGRAGTADHRSDIYSLGCTLYHMLCGRPPFTGPSPVGVISMHVTDQAPAVRSVVPEVPEAVSRVVDRMIAKDPAARFETYDELISALEAARVDRRELGGFRTRGLALAADSFLLGIAAFFLRAWALPLAFAYFILFQKLLGKTPGKWLLGMQVESAAGGKISWRAAVVRILAFAWGPVAWSLLAAVIYTVHRGQQITFRVGSLTFSQLAIPMVYVGIATLILVGYLAGFLLVAFHPRRLAVHDILAGTQVCFRSRPPAQQVAQAVRAATTRHR